jgi:hypothetical protein
MDYYGYHSQPSRNHFLEMGYDRAACPGQKEAEQIFCQHFCSHFRNRQKLSTASKGCVPNDVNVVEDGGVPACREDTSHREDVIQKLSDD